MMSLLAAVLLVATLVWFAVYAHCPDHHDHDGMSSSTITRCRCIVLGVALLSALTVLGSVGATLIVATHGGHILSVD